MRLLWRSCLFSVLIMSGFLLPSFPSHAEYTLGVGDVIELSVTGLPEIKQRSTVDGDGALTFPLIGRVEAEGLSTSALRREVGRRLSSKVLYHRAPDGREIVITIRPEEVSVALVEYRPVYTKGDVSKPGEYPFRPKMTVRHAVAVSGGYDVMRARMTNPYLEAFNTRAEYNGLWLDLAREQIRLARLEAEIDGKTMISMKDVRDEFRAPNFSEIVRLESEHLAARQADLDKEVESLKLSIAQSDKRLGILLDQQQKEQQGSYEDSQDFARVKALFEKGNIPITRVSDARRAMLLSSTRALETSAEAARVERERDELGRRLQKVQDQRRLDILRELQESTVKASALSSRIRSAGEKLLYVGGLRSQLSGEKSQPPELVVFRSARGQTTRIPADENTELQPGDVVEVTMQLVEFQPDSAAVALPPTSLHR